MSTCRRGIEQQLLEYLDGGIAPEEKRELEMHFEGCPPCLEFLKSYQATPELCRKHLVQRMPDEVADQLKSFLRNKLASK